ncbi:MAG: FKBP-type peptidyl-prolyl cis-trans isomerase [Myxococcaceae bacterium]|nr:FKBP-type peptidyl-prolyl cis-trans isomerase [Myxococcaceae bacterium]
MRAVVLAALLLAACEKKPKPAAAPQPPVTRESGLTVQVLRPGDGDDAKSGDKVTVHYVGTLADGGAQFDSTRDRDQPFQFWVGERQVIEGWDEGILGMREGELRRLTVPPKLGYGSERKPGIPPNSTLVFEVELVDVR